MKRDPYWDSLKFLLIVLVVYGHSLAPFVYYNGFYMTIYNIIYLFHMPLFIFVSGRFSHVHDKRRYIESILKLFETFVVFQILRAILLVLHGGNLTVDVLTTPIWILWYLVALIYWRLIIYYISSDWLNKHKMLVLIISFFISLVAGFIPVERIFVIQKSLALFPFFMLGYFSTEIDIFKYIRKIPSFVAVLFIIVFFFFLYSQYNRDRSSIIYWEKPYDSTDIEHSLRDFSLRCLAYFPSILLSIFFMRIIPVKSILAKWGGLTILIFIYHSFALKEVLFPLITRSFLPYNELLLLIYSVAIVLMIIYLSRFSFMYILMNPISFFINKRKVIHRLNKTNRE